MKRKSFIGIIASILALSLLIACGGSSPSYTGNIAIKFTEGSTTPYSSINVTVTDPNGGFTRISLDYSQMEYTLENRSAGTYYVTVSSDNTSYYVSAPSSINVTRGQTSTLEINCELNVFIDEKTSSNIYYTGVRDSAGTITGVVAAGYFTYGDEITTLAIPDTITTTTTSGEKTFNVTEIADNAFKGLTTLTTLTIGKNVEVIGSSAFEGATSLNSVTFANGSSLTSIGRAAFSGCTSLTSVTLPDSVTTLAYSVFEGCTSLTNATLSNKLTSIPGGTFRGATRLATVNIPNSVTSIGNYAFSKTAITEISIPSSVETVGSYAFNECASLSRVTVSGKDVKFNARSFQACSSTGNRLAITFSVGTMSEWKNTGFTFYRENYSTPYIIGENVTVTVTCSDGTVTYNKSNPEG